MLSAFKNFGVTFLIAALLFGIIAYFATGFVTGTVKSILEDEQQELDEIMQSGETETTPPDAETDVPPETDEKIPEGESFNFLVLTTDYRPDLYNTYRPSLSTMYNTDWYSIPSDETAGVLSGDYRESNLSTITMVRIDKENRQVVYSYFTPETRVYTSTGYHSLSEVYNIYGIDTLADYINSMTGLKFKYKFLINGYNLDEMIELLGSVTVNSTRDIYYDGKYPTMQYETTVERIGDDGNPWTEHIPNAYLQGVGELQPDSEQLCNMLSVIEKSDSELSAKSAYVIDILQKYLNLLGTMEKDQLKITLAQLITMEADWVNIEGLEFPEESETVESETESETETETEPETEPVPEVDPEEGSEETEEEEFDPSTRWTVELFEPENPIVETNYTMNEFDAVCEMLEAVTYFENVTITYPFEYKAATEEEEAHFTANTNAGLELYMNYRLINREE